MRRADIISSIKNIQRAIEDSRVLEVLANHMRSEKADIVAIFEVAQDYSNWYRSFNDNEKKILDIFKLDGLENPNFWAQITNAERKSRIDSMYEYYQNLGFMMKQLDPIIDLFKQDGIVYKENFNYGFVSSSNQENSEVLTIILPERENNLSSNPERLIKILNSINLFYKTCSILLGHEEEDLSVITIDSGSDKSFDFLGAAKVITELKELIIGLWDRVVFFREKKLHERMDLIEKSIPLIDTINNYEKEGKVSREQAEILRRNIFNGVNDFLAAGAILPEFSQHNNYNPRQLMSPEPKLLTTTNDISNTVSNNPASNLIETEDSDEEDDNLTETEKKLLEELLKKNSNKKRKK